MRLYFDLALGKLVRKQGFAEALTALNFKRGDAAVLEVSFVRDGVAAQLAVSGDPVQPVEMIFAVKASVATGAETLMLADEWTYVEASNVWRASLNADTEALAEVLGDSTSVNLLGEFTFTDDDGGPVTSQTISVTVFNDVWKGTEGTPLDLPTPEEWLAARATPLPLALVAPPVNGGAVLGMTINFDPVAELLPVGLDENDRWLFSTDGTGMIATTGNFLLCYVKSGTGLWTIDWYFNNALIGTYEAASGIPEYPWDADWTAEGLEVAAVLEVGTVGVLGQFAAVNGVVTHQCVDVDPMTWQEVDTVVRLTEQSLTSSQKLQARGNIAAVALPPQDFGTIHKVAFVGDSITGAASGVLQYGYGYMQNGFAAHARYAARGMIEMVANSVEPSFDFGIAGETTSGFQVGGTSRATFEAALASDADTVIYAVGANDCGSASYSAATTKANMLSQWDEIEAAEKKLVILSVFPGAVVRQTYYLANVIQLNHWIEYQAAIRGAIYINVTKVCDENKDGVSDMDDMQDLIHPNARGATKIGYLVADDLTPYLNTANAFQFPAYDSASWKTSNPYAHLGTVGSNQTATGWTITPTGAGTTVVKNLVDRTDIAGVGNWQELVISGATDAGTLIANPTHYTMLSISNAAVSISAGDRFIGVCELQPVADSTFYGASGFLFDFNDGSTSRRYDLEPNGAMASMKAGKYSPLRYGILRTPELVFGSSVTHDLRLWVYIYGNGTIRVGRFGIIKL